MAIQDKFNKPNVIYKITKDIDLGGETLTIPEGCTLDFQGGSFSNGTIIGFQTKILSNPTKIFNNIKIKYGSWDVDVAYSEWFGDIQTTLDNFQSVKLLPKKYDIYKGLLLRSGNLLYGTKGTELNFIVQGENCFKLSNNCKIRDFMVNLEDNDSTAVLVDGEYFTESINDNPNRFNISNAYAASRTYMVEGVEFWHRVGDINNIGSTVIKVIANKDTGYYGKIMRNCLAIGYWDCGILIDNGGDNVHSDGWLTDLKFSDIIMSTCRVGVKITKSVSVSENHEPARNIYFDCISYQSYAKNKVEEYDARAAILDSGWNIYFNNLNIWDWDPTSVKDRTPILINPNKCRNIVIDNGNSNIYYKRIYTFSEDYVYNNNKVGVNLILKDYMKSSYDISHFIDTTVENFDYKQFVTLPDGIYTLSDTLLSKIGLDSFTSGTVYVKKEIMVGSALMLTAFSTKKTYEGLPNSIAYCVFYLNSIGSIDSNAWNIIGNIAGKNKSKNNIYLDSSNYNKVVICHNNSEIYADGSAVGSKEVGTYAERPKSPRIGYMYFCTDKNIETSTKGSPIYYVGGGQWADITGKILPFEDYIS